MNRNTALWLGAMMSMGMEHKPTDSHCEKDGRHCTFLKDDHCGCYGVPLETDSEGHKKCSICEETNCMIARTP
jgi:hypothetical protein